MPKQKAIEDMTPEELAALESGDVTELDPKQAERVATLASKLSAARTQKPTDAPKSLASFGHFKYDAMIKMADLENVPVIIDGVDLGKGKFDVKTAVIRLHLADGSLASTITSSMVIVSALLEVEEKNAFPVSATFFKQGNMWWVR